jgi:hypothetical protein
MSGEDLKKEAAILDVAPKGHHSRIRKLIVGGVFDTPINSKELVRSLKEKTGKGLPIGYVQIYMKKFLTAGIIHAVKPRGTKQNYWVLASVTRNDALQQIGKTQKVRDIEEELFSSDLLSRLQKDFRHELEELRDNFGRNGNCTAFLLRKILEKLIIKAFLKHQKGPLLEDKASPGGWKGLNSMIEIATQEKHNGAPFLTRRTANEVKGIKFLGDVAAHNPLTSADMTTILPQMPFIVTAYAELAGRL